MVVIVMLWQSASDILGSNSVPAHSLRLNSTSSVVPGSICTQTQRSSSRRSHPTLQMNEAKAWTSCGLIAWPSRFRRSTPLSMHTTGRRAIKYLDNAAADNRQMCSLAALPMETGGDESCRAFCGAAPAALASSSAFRFLVCSPLAGSVALATRTQSAASARGSAGATAMPAASAFAGASAFAETGASGAIAGGAAGAAAQAAGDPAALAALAARTSAASPGGVAGAGACEAAAGTTRAGGRMPLPMPSLAPGAPGARVGAAAPLLMQEGFEASPSFEASSGPRPEGFEATFVLARGRKASKQPRRLAQGRKTSKKTLAQGRKVSPRG